MKISILGTEYTITRKKYEDDPVFKDRSIDGYCDGYLKEIVICDLSTYPGWENEPESRVKTAEKQTIRHEIVHAFLAESGLNDSAFAYDRAWAQNEEMVDWIAWQGAKLYEAWRVADAL